MKLIASLYCLILSISAFSQNFEGKIYYANSYNAKSKGLNDRQYGELYGTREEYIFKDGNYLAITNGSLIQWSLYQKGSNRIYSKVTNSDTLCWSDVTLNNDSVLKAEIKKNVTSILNYSCDELILTTKTGTHHYFYSSRFTIDPKLFVNHKLGNWYEFVKKAKALPLKMVVETPQYTMISEAMSVRFLELDPAMFKIDPALPVAKVN